MVFALQMAETKKSVGVKVVYLGLIYHPSNFLPSLKNTLYLYTCINNCNYLFARCPTVNFQSQIENFVCLTDVKSLCDICNRLRITDTY